MPASFNTLTASGHRRGIALDAARHRHRLVRRRLGDADDAHLAEAVEDGLVLAQGDLLRGLLEAAEVDVAGAALGVLELAPRHVELAPAAR